MNDVIRRRLQYGFSALILAALLFICLNVYQHRQPYVVAPPAVKATAHAPVNYAIQGFRFSSNQNGRRSLEIQADRFELKKKKVGMLRFGLMKEALFKHNRIKTCPPAGFQPMWKHLKKGRISDGLLKTR